MKKLIECPVCDGQAVLTFEKAKRIFRKEEYELYESFYKCNKCGEEFTTTDIDEVSISQVYNQYREKYGIPSPEQLTMLKDEYGLTSASFSKLLGFGINQYAAYEKGELPNQSNGTLLNLCLDPGEVLKLIERKKEVKLPEKIKKNLISLIEEESKDCFNFEQHYFNRKIIPNRFNGFTIPSFEKFANMVVYFIENAPFKTRLNKLLFYADFAAYKYSGSSISGMEYAAIPKGPVPDQYEIIFGILAQKEIIASELVSYKDEENERFVPVKKFDTSIFKKEELTILDTVFKHFRFKKTKDIIYNISHEEEAWKENINNKSIISYLDYAPVLKEI
ncbi:MAG: DUF4065 domain-containing protein [Ignavibacteria bacterium]|nr:DUF4065 domain-containing protein [Ignavibacteria bacterium]